MSHSSKKAQHEQARKKHKHDAEAHARELANRPPNTRMAWVVGIGLGLAVIAVLVIVLWP